MGTDFDTFKERHEAAMADVSSELDHLLPSELEHLSKVLRDVRVKHYPYTLNEVVKIKEV